MSKKFWNCLLFSPAVLGATLVASSAAVATESKSANLVVQSQDTSIETQETELLAQVPGTNSANSVANAPATTIRQINRYGREGRNLRQPSLRNLNRGNRRKTKGQVTSVSQLSDVQPTDWAFQALQSLVERYGCIVGYPDGTYRGNRALTRFEFAAGVNACLDRITELLQAAIADTVTREDLAILQRLQEEFSAELAILRGRVDALEARAAELEANQFSTTTKLRGEVIFAFVDNFEDQGRYGTFNDNTQDEDQTVFQYRVRLNFNTSFSGEDLLFTRLQAGNAQAFNQKIAEAEGQQTFNVLNLTDDTVELDKLFYKFPVRDNIRVTIAANKVSWYDFVPTLNPYMEDYDGGSGSLSAFGQRSPIYRLGGGKGLGVEYDFGCKDQYACVYSPFSVSFGYLAAEGEDPREGRGLFNGDYAALAQLTFTPIKNFQIGLTYNKGYFGPGNFGYDDGAATGLGDNGSLNSGFVGTGVANTIFGLNAELNDRRPGSVNIAQPVSTNAYGVQMSWRAADWVTINGFGMYLDGKLIGLGDFEQWSYGANIAFPDLFKEGSLGGIVVGREPYMNELQLPNGLASGLRQDMSWHIEAFYKYQVTDNISITPGVTVITNANQDDDNDELIIGTIRTTFQF
ncbi:MAG: iron uptake porin [Okeania sp. SIO2C2]|uniref:iron uptake porin n=1 Tax=Okeania sp. SIO2C2 TaxID=2607787 RepID=UPI0013B8F4DC|nr:iron uptake porin [Okeania sp. SIO2C2]NEP89696.1 iron uptake porin [Okeania sp. SIO2C2]